MVYKYSAELCFKKSSNKGGGQNKRGVVGL